MVQLFRVSIHSSVPFFGSTLLFYPSVPFFGFVRAVSLFGFIIRFHSSVSFDAPVPLQRLPSDPSDLVRIAFAESLASLAETSRRFLETAYAMRRAAAASTAAAAASAAASAAAAAAESSSSSAPTSTLGRQQVCLLISSFCRTGCSRCGAGLGGSVHRVLLSLCCFSSALREAVLCMLRITRECSLSFLLLFEGACLSAVTRVGVLGRSWRVDLAPHLMSGLTLHMSHVAYHMSLSSVETKPPMSSDSDSSPKEPPEAASGTVTGDNSNNSGSNDRNDSQQGAPSNVPAGEDGSSTTAVATPKTGRKNSVGGGGAAGARVGPGGEGATTSSSEQEGVVGAAAEAGPGGGGGGSSATAAGAALLDGSYDKELSSIRGQVWSDE